MFVSWHTLISYPPNAGNRDRQGQPKTTWVNGTWRGRQSSQAHNFQRRKQFGELPSGLRTRYVLSVLVRALVERGRDLEEADTAVREALAMLRIGMVPESDKTKVMLFLGQDEIQRVAGLIHEADSWEELLSSARQRAKAAAKGGKKAAPVTDEAGEEEEEVVNVRGARRALLEALTAGSRAVDLALFGRMIAESGGTNVTGAVQVAHSIGVAKHVHETDFFCTRDDLATDSGAGMIGDTAFSSGVFYGISVINWPRLVSNLRDDEDLAEQALRAYLWGTVNALLPGKQHSMYSHVPPRLIVAEIGEWQPWSLFNAFDKAVTAYDGQGDLVAAAVAAMSRELAWSRSFYGTSGLRATLVGGQPLAGNGVEQMATMDDLIDRAHAEVSA
jgi:CRISPR system Cascade subunit CasC